MPEAIIGPLIGVGGSLIGGLFGSGGSSKAADTQTQAALAAAETQRYMYDTTRQDYAPYRTTGELALARLSNTYGLGGYGDTAGSAALGGGLPGGSSGSTTTNSDLSAIIKNLPPGQSIVTHNGVLSIAVPGSNYRDYGEGQGQALTATTYIPLSNLGTTSSQSTTTSGSDQADVQARQQSAWDAFLNSPEYRVSQDFTGPEMYRSLAASQSAGGRTALNAAGGVANTGALRETARYASGLAEATYGDYYARLANMAGLGQAATSNLANIGQSAASNISSAQLQQGAAQASGYIGSANALSGPLGYGIGQIGQALGGYLNASSTPGLNQYGVGVPFGGLGSYNYTGATQLANNYTGNPYAGLF